jgi:hypothetical protein
VSKTQTDKEPQLTKMRLQFIDKPLNTLAILIALLGIIIIAITTLPSEGFKIITGLSR